MFFAWFLNFIHLKTNYYFMLDIRCNIKKKKINTIIFLLEMHIVLHIVLLTYLKNYLPRFVNKMSIMYLHVWNLNEKSETFYKKFFPYSYTRICNNFLSFRFLNVTYSAWSPHITIYYISNTYSRCLFNIMNYDTLTFLIVYILCFNRWLGEPAKNHKREMNNM